MIFYHGTSQKNYKKALKENVLWGLKDHQSPKDSNLHRFTYLTQCLNTAKEYAGLGGVVLRVLYDPAQHPDKTNYKNVKLPPSWIHWQVLVWEPISMSDVTLVHVCPSCGVCANRCQKMKTYFFKKGHHP